MRAAQGIELSICDAVHFRLTRPDSIFQLAELRLQERDPGRYAGFATCRGEVDKAMPGAAIKDIVDACCTRQPQWLDFRQILYSTELEVWMDMSYPNPWTLALYQAALKAGKVVTIPRAGPFTDTFHTLLKEKNGYELTQPALPPEQMVRIHVGEQSYLREPYLHLVTRRREGRRHPFGDSNQLGSQLAFGLVEKHIEDLSAREVAEDAFQTRAFGYHLFGPLVLLLLQELMKGSGAAAFTGAGAGFLAELAGTLRSSWPWLPELAQPGQASRTLSLVAEDDATSVSLLPGNPARAAASVLAFDATLPVDLISEPLQLFVKASLSGPVAGEIQAEAAAFVRDYAVMTRGLKVPLPSSPVVRYLCRRILSPSPGFVAWAGRAGRLPGFSRGSASGGSGSRLRTSVWPTATWLSGNPCARWWRRLRAGEQVRRIESARKQYQ